MRINPIHIFLKMNFCILWMLYYDRIDVSDGIDVNKTSQLKECDI